MVDTERGPAPCTADHPASLSQRLPVPTLSSYQWLLERNVGDLYRDLLRVIPLDLLVPGYSVWSVGLEQPGCPRLV